MCDRAHAMKRICGCICLVALLSACGSCKSSGDSPPAPGCELVQSGFGEDGTTPIRAETVVDGLEVPWSIAVLPGTNGSMLITERPGRLRLFENGALVPEPVATVNVDPGGEGGLQGLALDPQFAQNRRFFLYFTSLENGEKRNRLERWVLSADHHSATFDKVLLSGLKAAQFHHGGRIRIGPDGMLYVSVGDAREPDTAQHVEERNGKLLRLTVDGAVPADNPIQGNPLWLLGARNIEAFDWRDHDTLVIADHGPSGEFGRTGLDEVSVAKKGDNLGWPTIFGCEARAGMVTPSLTWNDAAPPGGGAIYTGDAIPGWKGSFLIGTLGSEHLHRVVFAADGRTVAKHEVYLRGALGRIRDVVMGPDGHLYATTSNCDGRGNCPATKDRIVRILPGG